MSSINPEFIERYQLIYQQDPTSKVFAPLAEAYRKMGLLDEAKRICEAGVAKHPNFPSGRVALAKILIETKNFDEAIDQLRVAAELSPENILAHSLLAESHLKKRQMKEALKAFKMVLFLNPRDERAASSVKKLESLTADEYEDDVFSMKKLSSSFDGVKEDADRTDRSLDEVLRKKSLERFLSLADAYIARNDSENALSTIERATDELGDHTELKKRKTMLEARHQEAPISPAPSKIESKIQKKISRLNTLLQRINERRIS